MAAHGALVGAVMLVPLLLRERPGERLLPWTPGAPAPESVALQLEGWAGIGQSLLRVFRLPVCLLLLGVAFAHGLFTGLFEATMPVLTVQELGWADTDYAGLSAMTRIVSGVLGMVLGGLLVERLGRRAAVGAMLGVIAVGSLAMGLLPALWASRVAVQAYAYAFQIAYVFASVGFFAMAMAACWKRVGATQFALFMAASNLGLSTGSALLGPIGDPFGFAGMFLAAAVCAAAALALLPLFDLPRHAVRLGGLDVEEIQRPRGAVPEVA
jgi:PAT family beta-lactamase induction signal transducer AmpG